MVSPKRLATAREAAETVAIQALGHIAADPQQLGRFLAETGLGPETLAEAHEILRSGTAVGKVAITLG